jgi:hypothetical protein
MAATAIVRTSVVTIPEKIQRCHSHIAAFLPLPSREMQDVAKQDRAGKLLNQGFAGSALAGSR